jgi:hypothetical protein
MSKATKSGGTDEAETAAKKKKPPANPVKEAILKMVHEKGVGGVVSPTHVAQLVSEEKWQRVLKDVRAEAVRLMKSGHVTIYRKGRPVENPDNFRGVYKIGLPGKPLPRSA